jgi:hypothetical protein
MRRGLGLGDLSTLPDEVILATLESLTPEEILKISTTSKYIYELLDKSGLLSKSRKTLKNKKAQVILDTVEQQFRSLSSGAEADAMKVLLEECIRLARQVQNNDVDQDHKERAELVITRCQKLASKLGIKLVIK